MSKPVSALNGAQFHGIAEVRDLGLQGMITLRGDLTKPKLKSAVKSVTGLALPKTGGILSDETGSVAWMSPDELLLLVPYAEVDAHLATLQKDLAKEHSLAVNVSDARAMFSLSGPKAREVLAKLVPVDLSPGAFEPGMMRRTRMAQVAAAFWMMDEDTFHIICFRSVARYVFDLLTVAAQEGSEVNAF
ncbi:sarcosine oxidase subunit gamma [Aestuariivita boseongensis]|uniref:sarcosine oxidase subunit gamma n=1 Tax=Aestuariivita boseongensis TaxID=1470562 RepID=UPI0006812640|nr:sarcosine oxidase subunit gamma family protein [Aestuariivita boseongensis]